MDEIELQMVKLKMSGYCCAQIMIKMALDAEEKENEDLVRAVSGLCFGSGSYQRTCGVLTSGIAILGLYAGKGNKAEYPKQDYSQMVDDYTEWFTDEFGSTECRDIIGACSINDYQTNQGSLLRCGELLVRSYQKLQEILGEHDYEFGSRDPS